jgi:hypothetical protein
MVFFCDQQHFKWRWLFPSPFFIEAGNGEDFEGAAKIENLYVLKQHDANTFSLHLVPPFLEPNEAAHREPGLLAMIFPRKSGHPSWYHFLFILHRNMVVNSGMQPIAVVESDVSPNG